MKESVMSGMNNWQSSQDNIKIKEADGIHDCGGNWELEK